MCFHGGIDGRLHCDYYQVTMLKGYIHVGESGQVVERMPLKISYSIIIRDVSGKNKQNTTKIEIKTIFRFAVVCSHWASCKNNLMPVEVAH